SGMMRRVTGMGPGRLAEEQRRGLTIGLGFAWLTIPSGREIGFVDVPGHERFVRNMLAGVGPVRLVLFVVAADEGWKPQSEEHLAILDVLGGDGGMVALTKCDLVDAETLDIAREEVRERVAGTGLEDAPIVACSSVTGQGLDELRAALDDMVAAAPAPPEGRLRQFVDRVFSIRGAGTVVTGTLTGATLEVGQEVEVYPTGRRARVRGLQTHKHPIERARPVSRVATNLVGVEREALERGVDVRDGFGLREAGARATVGGGVVIDVDPPVRPGPNPQRRLEARERAARDELPALLVAERGAVRTHDVQVLTGAAPARIEGAVRAGPWWVSEDLHHSVSDFVRAALERFHREHPLLAGADPSV